MKSLPDIPTLSLLLDALAVHLPDPPATLQGWQVTRVFGGYNNLVYRVTRGDTQLAVKWTRRDERDRAGREYHALLALQQLGLALAPAPVLIERARYALPVVVQTWLEGDVSAAPPATTAEWARLIEHLTALHRITPAQVTQPLAPATLTMTCAQDGIRLVLGQWERTPAAARTRQLSTLVQRICDRAWPTWFAPPCVLCRTDANPLNMIRRAEAWASVDWENSGWGDPAFDIADLLTHPACVGVPNDTWDAVVQTYAAQFHDRTLVVRIDTYRTLMLAWWAIFFTRESLTYGRGDQLSPLVERSAAWREGLPHQAAQYQRTAMDRVNLPVQE